MSEAKLSLDQDEILSSMSSTKNVSLLTTPEFLDGTRDFTVLKVKCGNSTLSEKSQMSNTKSFLILFLIFSFSFLLLLAVYMHLPNFEEEEKKVFILPRKIEQAKQIGVVLSKYKDSHFVPVTVGFFLTYIFLQTFAIPGSISLSILSGFLFHTPLALFFVCLASSVGASFCYLLFHMVGRRLVWQYIPGRAREWSEQVEKHKDHLINYIIFLRVTPFLPNWFINITSPVINIPLPAFFIGTFIGVAPPSLLAIQTGTTLHQLTSSSETWSFNSILFLAATALIAVFPILYKHTLKKKLA